jgi:hypothetical protein
VFDCACRLRLNDQGLCHFLSAHARKVHGTCKLTGPRSVLTNTEKNRHYLSALHFLACLDVTIQPAFFSSSIHLVYRSTISYPINSLWKSSTTRRLLRYATTMASTFFHGTVWKFLEPDELISNFDEIVKDANVRCTYMSDHQVSQAHSLHYVAHLTRSRCSASSFPSLAMIKPSSTSRTYAMHKLTHTKAVRKRR